MTVFLLGCIFLTVGLGSGLGVGMHMEYVLWNLKEKSEHDVTAKQLFDKYIQREIYVIIGIWSMGPLLFMLEWALSGESL